MKQLILKKNEREGLTGNDVIIIERCYPQQKVSWAWANHFEDELEIPAFWIRKNLSLKQCQFASKLKENETNFFIKNDEYGSYNYFGDYTLISKILRKRKIEKIISKMTA
ncbi:MAG: hypothetical protein N4A71_07970 [Carboxylicivirga sp.]|jgi:hypothetical protein|nr:hypothetical protein [Carboxylicivirga sp.]